MLLGALVNVIETLKERINAHGATLRQNETRTRMALIDPLLAALGWDTSDPELVTPEFISNGRADYALMKPGGKPLALVEAKKLGEPLENHRMQMLNYANASGIEYAGLTDGDRWELYEVFRIGALDDRRILEVSINGHATHACALQLLLLWRSNLASGRPSAANEPVLADPPTESTASQPMAPPEDKSWTSLLDLPPDISWRSKLSLIRFPSGEERTIQWSQWKRVLVEVAEWLIRQGAITGDKCPIGQVPQLHIIHSEPVHPSGRPFFHPALLSNALYLASASKAKRAASDCIFLMKFCQQDPASVHLKLG